MSALQVPAPEADRERIDQMVMAYRHQLERLYEMAFIAGAIAQVEDDRAKLRADLAKVSA